jgi:DNA-3-methyladenine glycosylase II
VTADPFVTTPALTESLPVAAPFNLLVTVRFLQRRPVNRVDRWENGRYVRLFRTPGGLRLISVRDDGTTHRPDLRLAFHGDEPADDERRQIVATVRWMLGLDAEPGPVDWLVEREPRFAPAARPLTGFRVPCFADLWETCLSVIPFQQLSLDAGVAIHGRIIDRWGPVLEAEGGSWRGMPTPNAIAEADPDALREAGLSRAKVTALQSLARRAIEGGLDAARFQSLSTDDARRELVKLPGIGPWSADVILLRGLRRVDLFPPGDTGSARGLTALLGLPDLLTPSQAAGYALQFGDRRGYLYFLSLGSQLIRKGILDPVRSL